MPTLISKCCIFLLLFFSFTPLYSAESTEPYQEREGNILPGYVVEVAGAVDVTNAREQELDRLLTMAVGNGYLTTEEKSSFLNQFKNSVSPLNNGHNESKCIGPNHQKVLGTILKDIQSHIQVYIK
jgi:hypothetical protein